MLSWVLLVAVPFQTGESTDKPTPAQIHIQHVMTSINGPPGNVGLLTILEEEASIAAQHAGLAVKDLTNLEAMQTHVHHLRHAIDPSKEPKGPGKGFGLSRAAAGVETHIKLAARSDGSTEHIKLHATHVSTSARNIVSLCEAILAESDKVLNAETAEVAAPAAQRIEALTQQILQGTDANGDGGVSWEAGEGGIAQVRQHMEIITSQMTTPSSGEMGDRR